MTDARERELLHGVLANPTDLQNRSVYADYLQAKGDPRGEFIALQLASSDKRSAPEQAKREQALLEQHASHWLGALAPDVREHEFEGGFPARLSMAASGLSRHEEQPLLATLRELFVFDVQYRHPETFLHQASLRQLEFFGIVPKSNLKQVLADEKWQVAGIAVNLPETRRGFLPPEQSLLSDFKGLPALRRLGLRGHVVTPRDFRWLWSTRTGARLEQLQVSADLDSLPDWFEEQAYLPSTLKSLEVSLHFGWQGWTAVASKGDSGLSKLEARVSKVQSRLIQPARIEDLTSVLEQLPADALETLRVTASHNARLTAKGLAALKKSAERQTRLQHLELPVLKPQKRKK